ncbi:MAG: hypothetical protein IT369_22315 [Candidatus Latescibacteria bacterium]|nr:hypothetical protein [Candidatus Latescibacterota bacterium]
MHTLTRDTATNQCTELLGLARACIARKEYQRAGTHVREALALDPSRPETLNLQGAVLELNRDWKNARRYYRAALAFDPAYQPAQINLSRTLPWCLRAEVRLG